MEEEEEKRRNIPVQQLPLPPPPNLLPLTSTLLNPKADNNNNNKAIDEGSQLQLQLSSDETQSTPPPPPQPSSHSSSSSSSNDEEDEEEEEDWEAIADRDLDVSFPSNLDATTLSCLSLDSSNVEVGASKHHQVRRRGRGSFMYERDGLYSDQQTDPPNIYSSSSEDEAGPSHSRSRASHDRTPNYGTRHILILAGFPASFRTVDLEKDFDAFKDRGFAIRWIDDTTALAVFPTPALAYEALKNVSFTYSVRVLEENDKMFALVSAKDLEPPRPRPKTSPRTAQRLIAQGMGRKPSTDFSSEDLRKQEEARRNRIQMRHKLREDAWEDNEP